MAIVVKGNVAAVNIPAGANIGTLDIEILPGAGVNGTNEQGGFITVGVSNALLSAVTTGGCTLTFSQP